MSSKNRDGGLRSFREHLWRSVTSPRILGFSVTIAMSTVVMGPFGTFFAMTFGERLFVWPILVFSSVVLGTSIQWVVRQMTPQSGRLLQIVIEALVLAAILTPITIGWILMVVGPWYEFYLTPPQLFAVVALSYAMTAATLGYSDPIPSTSTVPPTVEPRLSARIDPPTSAPIIHLTADNHYVRVTFADGSSFRLLLRLTDAVREMDGVDGFFVHRSHWVARSAIVSGFRRKGRDYIKLSVGSEIPVSKTYRPNLVSAGLLEPRD